MDVSDATDKAERSLPARVIRRFLDADGTSHIRALAYETMLVVLAGFIGLIGLAALMNIEQVRGVVTGLGRTIAPGPSGQLLQQAAASGARHATTAATFGLAAAAVAGTIAMAEVERAGNRLAGSGRDRQVVLRYVVAFVLAITVGVVFAAGGLALGAGRAIPNGWGWTDEFRTVWSIARWPLGVVVIAVAILLLYRFAPREPLAPWRSLMGGTAVAVVLWVAFTALLALYFSLSSGSSPYGPLLSIVALMLWAVLGSLAIMLGMSTAVELSDRSASGPESVVSIPDETRDRAAATTPGR